jgi:hypothetical protein
MLGRVSLNAPCTAQELILKEIDELIIGSLGMNCIYILYGEPVAVLAKQRLT